MIVAVVVPPVFEAVAVYTCEAAATVGVPLIAQVDVDRLKPVGSDGEIVQPVIAPPDLLGVLVVIAVPTVALIVFGE